MKTLNKVQQRSVLPSRDWALLSGFVIVNAAALKAELPEGSPANKVMTKYDPFLTTEP